MVFGVRLITICVEFDQIRKELNNINFAKLPFRFLHPIWSFEDYVTVHPCNAAYILRDGFDRKIEKSLLLPEDSATRDLYQNIRVFFGKLKMAIK